MANKGVNKVIKAPKPKAKVSKETVKQSDQRSTPQMMRKGKC